jgi:hypothetical protein
MHTLVVQATPLRSAPELRGFAPPATCTTEANSDQQGQATAVQIGRCRSTCSSSPHRRTLLPAASEQPLSSYWAAHETWSVHRVPCAERPSAGRSRPWDDGALGIAMTAPEFGAHRLGDPHGREGGGPAMLHGASSCDIASGFRVCGVGEKGEGCVSFVLLLVTNTSKLAFAG